MLSEAQKFEKKARNKEAEFLVGGALLDSYPYRLIANQILNLGLCALAEKQGSSGIVKTPFLTKTGNSGASVGSKAILTQK